MEKINKKLIFRKKNKMILLSLLLILVVIFLTIIIKNKNTKNNVNEANQELTKLIEHYYQEVYLGKINGLDTIYISLKDVIAKGYDVKKIESYCEIDSYGEIKIKNPEEIEKDKVLYSVIPHFKCQ